MQRLVSGKLRIASYRIDYFSIRYLQKTTSYGRHIHAPIISFNHVAQVRSIVYLVCLSNASILTDPVYNSV